MLDFGVSEKKVAELASRMAACGLREEDIEEQFVRSGGPGGQKVNRPQTRGLIPGAGTPMTSSYSASRRLSTAAPKVQCRFITHLQEKSTRV